MTTLEKILTAHGEAQPHMQALKEYSVNVANLCCEYIAEQVNTLTQCNIIRRSLAAVLDPSETPRSAEAKVEALRSQWPEARFDAVFDQVTGKVYIFVQ